MFYMYLINKKTKKHLKAETAISFPDQITVFIPISHISKSHTYKSIFGNTQIKASNVYTVNSMIDTTIIEHL